LNEQVESISSRQDFVGFLRSLLDDLRRDPTSWGNRTLESFIEAMAAWTEDMNGYYQNRHELTPEQSNWKVLGQILLAAKFYE
jgi:hypothetical protein